MGFSRQEYWSGVPVHGSNNLPSLLLYAAWLEKKKKTYTALWSDSFTDLLSPYLLGPQHCVAGLIQFQN